MFYTVYKITNKINSKIYVGIHQTKDLDDGYMGSGVAIHRAIKKYGKGNFIKSYLAIFDNKEDMCELEATVVNEDFIESDENYNIVEGGLRSGFYKDDRAKEMSILATAKKRELWENDEIWVFKLKENISNGLKKTFELNGHPWSGRKHKESTKQKMSQVAKERLKDPTKNTQYGTMWITDGVNSKKIKKDNSIPEGWKKGRVMVK